METNKITRIQVQKSLYKQFIQEKEAKKSISVRVCSNKWKLAQWNVALIWVVNYIDTILYSGGPLQ